MPGIWLETMIAAPIADCFDLSLSVEAHSVSMSASGERAVGGVTSGAVAQQKATLRAGTSSRSIARLRGCYPCHLAGPISYIPAFRRRLHQDEDVAEWVGDAYAPADRDL
jgi:hypothetical protein